MMPRCGSRVDSVVRSPAPPLENGALPSARRRRRRRSPRRRRRRRLRGRRRRRRRLRGRRRRRRRRSRRLRCRRRRRRGRGSGPLADAELLDEVHVTARDAHGHGARGLPEAAAQRRLHALACLLDEIHVAARDALEDGACVSAFPSARRVEAAVLQHVVLQVLVAREGRRDLEDRIELRALDDRAAALPVLSTGRTNATPGALDEVDVAARDPLGETAGAFAFGTTVVGACLTAHGEDERRRRRTGQDVANEPRVEQLRVLQGGPPLVGLDDRRAPWLPIA